MSSKDEVRNASNQFYAALNRMVNGDAKSLSKIWSHGKDASTLHPIGGRQVGWKNVRESWEQVSHLASNGNVVLEDQFVHTHGDVAYEIGVEHGSFMLNGKEISIRARVTNIYEKEGGNWKIIHHHTDIDPSMVEVLNQMKPS